MTNIYIYDILAEKINQVTFKFIKMKKSYYFYALTPDNKKIYKAGVGGLESEKQMAKHYTRQEGMEEKMKSDIKFALDVISGRNDPFLYRDSPEEKEKLKKHFFNLGLSDENFPQLTFHWELAN